MQDVISGMVVLPQKMMYQMNPATDFCDIYIPSFIGLARIRAHSGRGFQVEKQTFGHDVPDVYLNISLGSQAPWKTSTVPDNLNPTWGEDESHDFLVCSKEQLIFIEAYDEDSGSLDKDDFLGEACVTVAEVLLMRSKEKTFELELFRKEKKGSIKSSGCYVTLSLDLYPLTTKNLSKSLLLTAPITSADKQDVNATTIIGLLTVLVSQVHDLPVPKKEAASCVKVYYGDQELGTTSVVTDCPGYDALNPIYACPFHLPISSAQGAAGDKTSVKLQLLNNENVLGDITIAQGDIVKAGGTIRETRMIGSGKASVSFSVSLSSASAELTKAVAGDATSATDFAESTSTPQVRVSIVKGFGFVVKRKGRLRKKDIPDVYCLVKFGSSPSTWRTSTCKDTVSPVWDNEYRDYPLASPNQIISVDVWDANSRTKDDYYGNARTSVGKVLLNGGAMDVEIMDADNKKTGLFITVGCHRI